MSSFGVERQFVRSGPPRHPRDIQGDHSSTMSEPASLGQESSETPIDRNISH